MAIALPGAVALSVRGVRRSARTRYVSVCVVLGVICFVAICATCLGGSYPIPPAEVPKAVFGFGDPTTVYIVQQLRIPRSVLALCVGVAFGLSGAVFQSLARNPLASPDIIGISAGASLGAVIAIATVGARTVVVPVSALVGAVAAGAVIVAFSLRRTLAPMRLILVGIGLQAVLGAATGMLLDRLNKAELANANRWLSGSLNALSWGHVQVVAIGLAALAPLLWLGRRPLAVLQLGEDVARSAGVAAGRWQLALVLIGCALCSIAVSVAGPIVLLGFIGPPIARRLAGTPGPALVASGLVAGTVLVLADLVARYGLGSLTLPVGLLTGVLGAPVLIYVLLRRPTGSF